jgi:hypothetical protein
VTGEVGEGGLEVSSDDSRYGKALIREGTNENGEEREICT